MARQLSVGRPRHEAEAILRASNVFSELDPDRVGLIPSSKLSALLEGIGCDATSAAIRSQVYAFTERIVEGKFCFLEFAATFGLLIQTSNGGSVSIESSCEVLRTSLSPEDFRIALTTALTYVENLLADFRSKKFRRVRRDNRLFRSRLGAHEGGEELMMSLGFVLEHDCFVFHELSDKERLRRCRTVLEQELSALEGGDSLEQIVREIRERHESRIVVEALEAAMEFVTRALKNPNDESAMQVLPSHPIFERCIAKLGVDAPILMSAVGFHRPRGVDKGAFYLRGTDLFEELVRVTEMCNDDEDKKSEDRTSLHVSLDDTIGSLRSRLQSEKGTTGGVLRYEGRTLDVDSKTLREVGVTRGSEIFLDTTTTTTKSHGLKGGFTDQILLRTLNTCVAMSVNTSIDTIKSFRSRVSALVRVRSEYLRLVMSSSSQTNLNESTSRTLRECGITSGSEILVHVRLLGGAGSDNEEEEEGEKEIVQIYICSAKRSVGLHRSHKEFRFPSLNYGTKAFLGMQRRRMQNLIDTMRRSETVLKIVSSNTKLDTTSSSLKQETRRRTKKEKNEIIGSGTQQQRMRRGDVRILSDLAERLRGDDDSDEEDEARQSAAARLFDAMDLDRNGVVDAGEWRAYVNKHARNKIDSAEIGALWLRCCASDADFVTVESLRKVLSTVPVSYSRRHRNSSSRRHRDRDTSLPRYQEQTPDKDTARQPWYPPGSPRRKITTSRWRHRAPITKKLSIKRQITQENENNECYDDEVQAQMIRNVFNRIDLDGDGHLSHSDVRAHLRQSGRSSSEKDVDEWIKARSDDDNSKEDKYIRFEDFVKHFGLNSKYIQDENISRAFGTLRLSSSPAEAFCAAQTLIRILESVQRNPEEKQYRRVHLRDRTIQENILCLIGGMDLMESVGFVLIKKKKREESIKEERMVLRNKIEHLSRTIHTLRCRLEFLTYPEISDVQSVSSAVSTSVPPDCDAKSWKRGIELIQTYAKNILRNPLNAKYRSIDPTSRIFRTRLGTLPRKLGLKILVACGFRESNDGLLTFNSKMMTELRARSYELRVGLEEFVNDYETINTTTAASDDYHRQDTTPSTETVDTETINNTKIHRPTTTLLQNKRKKENLRYSRKRERISRLETKPRRSPRKIKDTPVSYEPGSLMCATDAHVKRLQVWQPRTANIGVGSGVTITTRKRRNDNNQQTVLFVERVEQNLLILERATKESYDESDRVVRVDVPATASKRFWKRHRVRKNVRDIVLDIISKACDRGIENTNDDTSHDDVSRETVPFDVLSAKEIDQARNVQYEQMCVSTSNGTIVLKGIETNVLALKTESCDYLQYETTKVSESFRRLEIQEMCAVRSPTTHQIGDAVLCLLKDGTGLVLNIADHDNEIARLELLSTLSGKTSRDMLQIVHGSGYEISLNSTSLNGTIRVLNYLSGKSICASRPNTNHSSHVVVSCASIRVNASQLVHAVAFEGCKNDVYIVDARSGDTLSILNHEGSRSSPIVRFSSRRGLLFTADQRVRVWNLSRDLFWRLRVGERGSFWNEEMEKVLHRAVMRGCSSSRSDDEVLKNRIHDDVNTEFRQARVVSVNQERWTATVHYLEGKEEDRHENDVDLDRFVCDDDTPPRLVRIDDVVCVRSCDNHVETFFRKCIRNALGTENMHSTASRVQIMKLLHVEMRVPKDYAEKIVETEIEETSPGKYSVRDLWKLVCTCCEKQREDEFDVTKHLASLVRGTALRTRCCVVLKEKLRESQEQQKEEKEVEKESIKKMYEGEISFQDFYDHVYAELVESERRVSKQILRRALVGTRYRDVVDFNILSAKLESRVPILEYDLEFCGDAHCDNEEDDEKSNSTITAMTYMPVSASIVTARTDGTICVYDSFQEQQGGDALRIRLKKNETVLRLVTVLLRQEPSSSNSSKEIPVEYVVGFVGHTDGTKQIRTWRIGRTCLKITRLEREMEMMCAYTGVNEAMRRTSQHAFESYWKRELAFYFLRCQQNEEVQKTKRRKIKIDFETLIVGNTISATESLMSNLISSPEHSKYVEDCVILFESIRRDLIRHGGLESTLYDRVRMGPFLRAVRAASKYLPNLIRPVLAGDAFVEQIRKLWREEREDYVDVAAVFVTKLVLEKSVRQVLKRRVPLNRVADFLRVYRKKYFPSIHHLHRHLESCESGFRFGNSQDDVVAFDSKSLSKVLVSLDPWSQLENRFERVRRHIVTSSQNHVEGDGVTPLMSYVRRIVCFVELERRVDRVGRSVRRVCVCVPFRFIYSYLRFFS